MKPQKDDLEQDSKKKPPKWMWITLIVITLFLVSNTFSYQSGIRETNQNNKYFGPASCAKAFIAINSYLKTSQAELSSALTNTPVETPVSVDEVAKLRKQCTGELAVVVKESK